MAGGVDLSGGALLGPPGVVGGLPVMIGISSGSLRVLKEAVVIAVRRTEVHFDSPENELSEFIEDEDEST